MRDKWTCNRDKVNTSISREKELLPQRKEKEEEVELGALKFMSRKVHLAK